MSKDNELVMFVVYNHPSDFPDYYVVRKWVVDSTGGIGADMTPYALEHYLSDARRKIPPGLVCIKRYSYDDPVILEVWV